MKKIFIVSVLTMVLIFATFNTSIAMTYYENVDFVTGMVTATSLNVRCGPGTNYKSIGLIYKNQYVRVFAKVGDWYVVQTESDLIGAVSKKYIKNATTASINVTPKNDATTGNTNKVDTLSRI